MSDWNYNHPSTCEGVTGIEPAIMFIGGTKNVLPYLIFLSFSVLPQTYALSFLFDDYHHVTRFNATCPLVNTPMCTPGGTRTHNLGLRRTLL